MLKTQQIILGPALTVLIYGDGGALGRSQEPSPSNDTPTAQGAQQATPGQRGTEQVPLIVKVSPAQKSQAQTDKEERDRIEKAEIDTKIAFETQRIADYTDRLVKVTFFVAIIAFLQAILFGVQLTFMRDDIRRAREEFISTHRPRVIVRFIQGGFDSSSVVVANVGASAATIQEFGGDLVRRKGNEWLSPGDGAAKKIDPIRLLSGQRHTFPLVAKVPYGGPEIFDDAFATAETAIQTCAFGEIRYSDENGIVRETGFFRVFDTVTERFIPSENKDEEYQD